MDNADSLSKLLDQAKIKENERVRVLVNEELKIKRRRALIVLAEFEIETPLWEQMLNSFLPTNKRTSLSGVQRAGLLLVKARSRRHAWALSFGRGSSLLDSDNTVPHFGRLFTLQNVQSDAIRSVSTTSIGQKLKKGQVSYPESNNYWNFPIEPMTDLVERVHGPVKIGETLELTSGVHSLNIPVRFSEDHILDDLNEIEDAGSSNAVDSLLDRQIISTVEDPNTVNALNGETMRQLLTRLFARGDQGNALEIFPDWPTEKVELVLNAESFRAHGFKANALPQSFSVTYSEPPAVESLLEIVKYHLIDGLPAEIRSDCRFKPDGDNLEKVTMSQTAMKRAIKAVPPLDKLLKKLKISVSPDGNHDFATKFNFSEFMSFELTMGGTKYFSQGGTWYSYSGDIQEDFERIYSTVLEPSSSSLRDINKEFFVKWGTRDEKTYNQDLATAHQSHTLLLDREKFQARGSANDSRSTTFEPADVITDQGHLIHVKRYSNSAAISHLCMQAANSALGILRHDGARESFFEGIDKAVEETGEDTRFRPASSTFQRGSMTVVIAIASEVQSKTSIKDLPFMSLMAIARLDTILRMEGIPLEVWFIESVYGCESEG